MKLEIRCKTSDEKRAAEHFLLWLCESGEQDYWAWMDHQESKDVGNITILRFKYDWRDMAADCTLGRLDDEE